MLPSPHTHQIYKPPCAIKLYYLFSGVCVCELWDWTYFKILDLWSRIYVFKFQEKDGKALQAEEYPKNAPSTKN